MKRCNSLVSLDSMRQATNEEEGAEGIHNAAALRPSSLAPYVHCKEVSSHLEREVEKKKSTYGRESEISAVVSRRIDDPLPRMLERVSSSSK